MKRGLVGTLVGAALVLSGVATAASAVSATAPAAPPSATRDFPATAANPNDFTFDSFDAQYELGRDDEGRSTLHTTETLVAVFPEFDQNRGFIRDIPSELGGRSTDVEVLSVTDGEGNDRPFSTEAGDEFVSVTIAVSEGQFVHGTQQYVIEYTQRDVTRLFSDTAADEFYWDVNGTGWAQPFGRVGATLTLSDGLDSALTGEASCYRGAYGSSDSCQISTAGGSLQVDEYDFLAGENLTIAAGFAPGTFAGPPVPFLERVPLLHFAGLASMLGGAALTVFLAIWGRISARTGRAIIAQYDPPEGVSVAVAAILLKAKRKAATATLLDLAVRRKIRLLYDAPSGLYGAQLVDADGLKPPGSGFVKRLFPPSTLWFERKSTRLGDAAANLVRFSTKQVEKDGFIVAPSPRLSRLAVILLVVGFALVALQAIILQNVVTLVLVFVFGIFMSVSLGFFAVIAVRTARRRSSAGALLHDHLMGLREYIRLAEADRIRLLQSASGAAVGEDRVVQVYERLLPYAVIFGLEREWQGELARYYRESAPDWVANTSGGDGSFLTILPIAGFQSSVSSSAATQSPSSFSSSSSSSSSSGGSSGGGFSGGGGGGGGGSGI